MKKFSLLVLAVAVCSVSFAQTKPAKPAAKAKVFHCAVTGEKLDVAKATKDKMFTDYKGKRYFFCCPGCPETFKKNPEKYVKKADSIPTPKVKKA